MNKDHRIEEQRIRYNANLRLYLHGIKNAELKNITTPNRLRWEKGSQWGCVDPTSELPGSVWKFNPKTKTFERKNVDKKAHKNFRKQIKQLFKDIDKELKNAPKRLF